MAEANDESERKKEVEKSWERVVTFTVKECRERNSGYIHPEDT